MTAHAIFSGGGGGGGGGSSLALSLNTTVAAGSAHLSTVTSNVVTGTASGGTGPYSYAWTVTSAYGIGALNPTSASSAFRATGVVAGDDAVGTAVLRVTDNVGAIKDSATVNITLTNTNTS